jgi:hypothetical protein
MNVLAFPECLTSVNNYDIPNSKLYPNPANDFITIESYDIITSVSIYNSAGEIMEQKTLNSKEFNLNLDDYNNGLYLVKVTSEKGSYVHRFIKL